MNFCISTTVTDAVFAIRLMLEDLPRMETIHKHIQARIITITINMPPIKA